MAERQIFIKESVAGTRITKKGKAIKGSFTAAFEEGAVDYLTSTEPMMLTLRPATEREIRAHMPAEEPKEDPNQERIPFDEGGPGAEADSAGAKARAADRRRRPGPQAVN